VAEGREADHEVRHPVHRALAAVAPLARRLRQRLHDHAGVRAEAGHPRHRVWPGRQPERLRGRHPGRVLGAAQGRYRRAPEAETQPAEAHRPPGRRARRVRLREPAARGVRRPQAARRPALDPCRQAAGRLGRDRQLPDARPRQLDGLHLALPAGDPAALLGLGRDPPPVLDVQVPLRPEPGRAALAELPRVVLEPGRLVPDQAILPAASVGAALLRFAAEPLRRRLLLRTVRRAEPRHRAGRATPRPIGLYAADGQHQAVRPGRLGPQPVGEQPGRGALPRHHAAGTAVHAELPLPALRRWRRHQLRPHLAADRHAGEPCAREPALRAGHLPRRGDQPLRAHHRRVGELTPTSSTPRPSSAWRRSTTWASRSSTSPRCR